MKFLTCRIQKNAKYKKFYLPVVGGNLHDGICQTECLRICYWLQLMHHAGLNPRQYQSPISLHKYGTSFRFYFMEHSPRRSVRIRKSKHNAERCFRVRWRSWHPLYSARAKYKKSTSRVTTLFGKFRNTFWRISRCPWLAARWSGVSSPILVCVTRAPRDNNMSTILPWPSFAAQWRRLNPWSSLHMQKLIISQQNLHKNPTDGIWELGSCSTNWERFNNHFILDTFTFVLNEQIINFFLHLLFPSLLTQNGSLLWIWLSCLTIFGSAKTIWVFYQRDCSRSL